MVYREKAGRLADFDRSGKLAAFFQGHLYPLLVTALVLIGALTGYEVYTLTVNVLLVSAALIVSPTVKPLLPFLLTFFYQISVKNTPTLPTGSDYYFTGWRPPLLIFLVLILVISAVIHFRRNGFLRELNPFRIPLFFPLLIFSVGMVLNGLMYEEYVLMNFVYGFGQLAAYFFLFVVLYIGLRKENPDELIDYFTYLTFLMSWILIIEMVNLYMTGNIIVDGKIEKGSIILGFGTWNLIGFHLTTLIPMNIYGLMRGKHPIVSLLTALAVYATTVATLSRNSVLFGTLILVVSLLVAAFAGERRRLARMFIAAALVGCAVLCFAFRDQIALAIADFADRGLDDSGRFNIWENCYNYFKENPIFGAGFYGMHLKTYEYLPFDLVPEFAHLTILQLLGATGLVGAAAYLIYRIATVRIFVVRPTLDKVMLGLAASVIVLESLLDNYVFQMFTTFYYTTAIIIALMLDRHVREEKQGKAQRIEALVLPYEK